MSLSFSAAEFVQRALALGPDFVLHGVALGEKKTVDSAFLLILTDREICILFAFTPKVHQAQLESLLPQRSNAPLDVHVENALPSLALNSDVDCDVLLAGVFVQGAQISWQQQRVWRWRRWREQRFVLGFGCKW
jgi:hypothetical protein